VFYSACSQSQNKPIPDKKYLQANRPLQRQCYYAGVDIDELKNERFLSVTQADAAYKNVKRELDEALSISGARVKQSGTKIEVSGSTSVTPPQPTKVLLSRGDDHYELALKCSRAFEAFKRVSGQT
jgi:hypothetical protein